MEATQPSMPEIVAAQAQAAARELRPKMGPMPNQLNPGDVLTFTAGREQFMFGDPEASMGFEVGPITVTVTVQPGEEAGQAYGRAATVAYQAFETEFQLKRGQYRARLAELEKA